MVNSPRPRVIFHSTKFLNTICWEFQYVKNNLVFVSPKLKPYYKKESLEGLNSCKIYIHYILLTHRSGVDLKIGNLTDCSCEP